MAERQLEVHWVPSDTSQFVTWGSELRHYQVVEEGWYGNSRVGESEGGKLEEGLASISFSPSNREPLSGQRSAVLLDKVAEPHYIQCVDLWGGQGVVVAAGQNLGRISFVTFRSENGDGCGLFTGRELLPRTERPCATLAWHPASHNILASGYERHRSDFGLLVWNLERQEYHKPVAEMGMTDSCASLAWFHSQQSVVAGVNGKMVRMYDIRNPSKAASTTTTRATAGLSVDPTSEHRVAGYADTQVVIWDTRNFEKPVVSLETGRMVARLAWCPTRPGLLANSGKDSPSIMLHDIMSWAVGQEDGEPAVSNRSVAPAREVGGVGAFAWHPSRENTILAVGIKGFSEWTVSDRLTLNWSARHALVWSAGRVKLRCLSLEEGQLDIEDVSITMESRARQGYSGSNAITVVGGGELGLAWGWLRHAENLGEVLAKESQTPLRCPGVRALIMAGSLQSESLKQSWVGIESRRTVRVFRSEDRGTVLKLCGWDEEQPLQLSEEDAVARAARQAAVAVFKLDLRRAMQALQDGAAAAKNAGRGEMADILSVVRVALSGYSSEGSGLWRETVAASLSSLPDPALRAVFSFLTCQDESFSSVLCEEGLLLSDRLAFASTFLSDPALCEWVESEWKRVLTHGNLEGLLLAGSEADVVSLIQSYVDRTGDVQTATWLVLRCLDSETARNEPAAAWVESYRGLLDQWRLFPVRAELDIALNAAQASQPAHQVFVSCHYCAKSVSPWYKGLPKVGKTGSLQRAGGAANKVKLQSCPNCKKPLPRCSVCLVNMGTASGLNVLTGSEYDRPVSQFGDWFTWCQSCRHGGHASHLLHWFSLHSDCPVTGCSCRCAHLDAESEIGI